MLSFVIESPLSFAAIAALSLVAAAELLFRIRYRAELRIRVYPQVYVPDEDLGYRYTPNTEGEIRVPGIRRRFRTNNKGFNGHEYVKEKPPGTYRIAIVGPSNSTGIWVDGQGANYAEMLEQRLREAGHTTEVMNFGIDGRFRSVYELRIIDTDVAAYAPDLVLLDVELPFVYGSFRRDVYNGYVMIYNSETPLSRSWCELTVDQIRRQRLLIALYRASYIVRALARYYTNKSKTNRAHMIRVFIENRIQAPDIVLLPYSLKKSVEALQAARKTLADQGGKLVLFQYAASPYFRHVSTKYELPYIELDVPPVAKYVHPQDAHYGYQGHVEVAKQLFDRLIERGFLEAHADGEP